jgi:hypothetical protein
MPGRRARPLWTRPRTEAGHQKRIERSERPSTLTSRPPSRPTVSPSASSSTATPTAPTGATPRARGPLHRGDPIRRRHGGSRHQAEPGTARARGADAGVRGPEPLPGDDALQRPEHDPVDGDRATGESYCIAHHLYAEEATRMLMAPGSATSTSSSRSTAPGSSLSASSTSIGPRPEPRRPKRAVGSDGIWRQGSWRRSSRATSTKRFLRTLPINNTIKVD